MLRLDPEESKKPGNTKWAQIKGGVHLNSEMHDRFSFPRLLHLFRRGSSVFGLFFGKGQFIVETKRKVRRDFRRIQQAFRYDMIPWDPASSA